MPWDDFAQVVAARQRGEAVFIAPILRLMFAGYVSSLADAVGWHVEPIQRRAVNWPVRLVHGAIGLLSTLAVLFVSTNAGAAKHIPSLVVPQMDASRPVAAPDHSWLLAQAGGACPSTAPTGVEELLVRQAGDLYAQAQRAQGSERRDLLQRTLTLIDTLVQAQPDSMLACQEHQPGAQVGGIPLAHVRAELATESSSASCPALNASRRAMVEELLRSYGGSRQDIGLVAEYADHALLAWGAYDEPDVIDLLGERGWQALRPERGESDGIVGDVSATLFVSRSGQHVLAFRGTQTLGDVLTDATVLPSDQVVEAARMALRIRDEFPDVVFVGHSMGGRFAQLARVLTGNSAVVFNAAPGGLPDGVIRSIVGPVAPRTGTVFLHFTHARDVVSSINPTRSIVVANAVSSDFELPPESHLLGPRLRGALSLATGYFTQRDVHHNMGMLAQAMQLVRIAQEEGWIDAHDCHQRQRLSAAGENAPMPLENAAIGATANSSSPVRMQPPSATPARSDQAPEDARPAWPDDALRRASATGPSVDLVRAYAWLGQRDLAIRTLIQLSEEVSSFRVGSNIFRLTRGRDLVNWLASEGRPSDALSYLDQLLASEFKRQAPNSNIDLFPWVTAGAYQKAGQLQDAQRWTRIFLQQYRLPHQYGYLRSPRNQVDAAAALTRLGSTVEADRILDDVLGQGCRLSLDALSRMASGGHHATRRAMASCSRQLGDVLVARLAEGLARGSDPARAVALLQERRLTLALMPVRFGGHGILGLVAFSDPARRNEVQQELQRMQSLVDRLPHRCDRFFRQVAIADVAHFHKMTDVYLNALAGERQFARMIRAGSFSPNSCDFDANILWQGSFSRMEGAVSHYAKQGQTDVAVEIATELDRRVGTLDARLGVSYGARVLAGALALAEAQQHQHNNQALSSPPSGSPAAGALHPVETATPTNVQPPAWLPATRISPLGDPSPVSSATYFDPEYPLSWSPPAQHLGIDLPAPSGTIVVTPVAGTVVVNNTDLDSTFEKHLIIQDAATGAEHVLGHIESSLPAGTSLTVGQPVGAVMTAGTGPHVHWGINTRTVYRSLGNGWGWGRAPHLSTRDDAASLGWIDPAVWLRTR